VLRSLVGNLIPNKWYQSYGDGSRFECLIWGRRCRVDPDWQRYEVRKKKKKKFESVARSWSMTAGVRSRWSLQRLDDDQIACNARRSHPLTGASRRLADGRNGRPARAQYAT